MENNDFLIESLLLGTPDVVKFSRLEKIEVKPGIFSPIFINLKHTLPEYKVRHTIVRKFSELVGDDIDYICGMESGGTYYASAIADLLLKPVVLFRKKNKDYGDHRRIVGDIPVNGSKVAIIDDVFATGLTVSEAVKYFHNIDCKVKIFSIFSYGFNKEIGLKLGVEVYSLSNFDNLCYVAEMNHYFSNEDVNFLINHVSTYKNFLLS